MPQDIQSEVGKLIKEVNKLNYIERIYLFGSFAYGNPNRDSDIDLCFITNDNKVRKRELVRDIRKSIARVAEMPVDILVYDKDEFFERAALESTFEHKIAHEGVSVYEQ